MKELRLVEVGFTYHLILIEPGDWQQFVIRASRDKDHLAWSFSISGPDGGNDVLPVELIEALPVALKRAQDRVHEEDLSEGDPGAADCGSGGEPR